MKKAKTKSNLSNLQQVTSYKLRQGWIDIPIKKRGKRLWLHLPVTTPHLQDIIEEFSDK
ncbi:hypothetical protein IC620_09805 [Hazenella sp. IB182357]|uniref:Uncharacterized protein n=1 Tax=Polycladospora coralii TaxID=2771432 RepID=A0A926NG09_9BACL|nr:hypothetical protein [Polycladospora coralii]MBD1372648.1 hypothetical protein [Polycladospora coralii]MBS7531244.1 hypothetical protein [Polycladospora coralii]